MYSLLCNVQLGSKTHLIEKADLITCCQYSPTGNTSEDLKLARSFMDGYFYTKHSTARNTSNRNVSSASSSSNTLHIIPDLRCSNKNTDSLRTRASWINREITRQQALLEASFRNADAPASLSSSSAMAANTKMDVKSRLPVPSSFSLSNDDEANKKEMAKEEVVRKWKRIKIESDEEGNDESGTSNSDLTDESSAVSSGHSPSSTERKRSRNGLTDEQKQQIVTLLTSDPKMTHKKVSEAVGCTKDQVDIYVTKNARHLMKRAGYSNAEKASPLTDNQKKKIEELFKTGKMTQKEIAEEVGCTKPQVSLIVKKPRGVKKG